jgi:predicted MFS family arabinose efflux permease
MGAGTAIVFAYLPSFAVDTAGLSIAAAGATTLVFGSTALFCRLGLGLFLRVTTQTDSRLLLMMALGSVAIIAIIAAGAVVFGATRRTWPALAFLAVVRAGPPGGAGRATGWVTAAFYLGLWVTPPIAGRLIVTAGYAWMWVAAAACYLLAVVPLWSARVASRPPVAGPVR